ncbi:MAG: glucose-1-phosphate thymidylyltransferase [Muribaculaceae bacterium]|nr:glucose-1-phosphate thymidylyltransferase [Muribaculaceae bacterium]MDE7080941.1 glucose-1-phosphate thymidylyltransferase [Muribaculaceae bacterium]
MRQIVLFDTESVHADLLPMSYTRPVAAFRIGIRTLREQWEEIMPGEYFYRPVWFQRDKFGMPPQGADDLLFVAGNLMPREETAALLMELKLGEAAVYEGQIVAFRGSEAGLEEDAEVRQVELPEGSARLIRFPYDIFQANAEALCREYRRLTSGRRSAPLDESNRVIGSPVDADGNPMIFIEEGAVVEGATINVKEGPVYIGRDAVVMEGACVRGPLALCEHAQIKMGAKIYGGTTFGPYCKIGGEVQNTVIFGYSNKAHDGYLGNAVIGEWCNLGAGVNASNLKNDYAKIRLWNYPRHTFMRTDLQFCGLIMADHSKAGINCMFNTATVVGVGVNLHGAGFPRVFIPSFQEGSPAGGMTDVPLKKFYQIAERVMGRRGLTLTDADRCIYERVYEVASQYKAPKSR